MKAGGLIKIAHIARFIVAARLIVQDHEGVPMMPLFRLSSVDIAGRPSPVMFRAARVAASAIAAKPTRLSECELFCSDPERIRA
jgi:hypothetical protein